MKNNFKKIIIFCIAILSMFVVGKFNAPNNVLADTLPVISWSGNGTEQDPYILKTAEDLKVFAYCVNHDISSNGRAYSELYYELGADINLNKNYSFEYDVSNKRLIVIWMNNYKCAIDNYGYAYDTLTSNIRISLTEAGISPYFWTPIGDGVNTFFSGSFDGKGYTISGLFFDEYLALTDADSTNDVQQNYFAVFGGVKSFLNNQTAVIKNLKVENSFFYNSNNASSIVGKLDSSALMYNCSSNATIFSSVNSAYSAGLVANNAGRLSNSYFNGTVNGAKVGGLVGNNSGYIQNCVSCATYMFDNDSNSVDLNIGAIAHTNTYQIKDCYYYYNQNLEYTRTNSAIKYCTSIGYFNQNDIITPVGSFTLSYGSDLLYSLRTWADNQPQLGYYFWDIKTYGYLPYLKPIISDVNILDNVVTFDGVPHSIIVEGLREEDDITYSTNQVDYDHEIFAILEVQNKPTTVYVKVEREGFAVLLGSATIKINVAYIPFPELEGEYLYNGHEQQAVLNGVQDFAVSLSNNVRTSAGKEYITCSLKYPSSCLWVDGTTDDYNIEWDIKKQTAYISDIRVPKKTYDGTKILITPDDYNISGDGNVLYYYKLQEQSDEYFTLVAPINAGNYVLKIVMQETENYAQSIAMKSFSIKRQQVEIPTNIEPSKYTGKRQFANIETSDKYRILNDSAIDSGTYTAYLVLNDTTNYEWEDGTIKIQNITWKIDGSGEITEAGYILITFFTIIVVEIVLVYIYWFVIKKKTFRQLLDVLDIKPKRF